MTEVVHSFGHNQKYLLNRRIEYIDEESNPIEN